MAREVGVTAKVTPEMDDQALRNVKRKMDQAVRQKSAELKRWKDMGNVPDSGTAMREDAAGTDRASRNRRRLGKASEAAGRVQSASKSVLGLDPASSVKSSLASLNPLNNLPGAGEAGAFAGGFLGMGAAGGGSGGGGGEFGGEAVDLLTEQRDLQEAILEEIAEDDYTRPGQDMRSAMGGEGGGISDIVGGGGIGSWILKAIGIGGGGGALGGAGAIGGLLGGGFMFRELFGTGFDEAGKITDEGGDTKTIPLPGNPEFIDYMEETFDNAASDISGKLKDALVEGTQFLADFNTDFSGTIEDLTGWEPPTWSDFTSAANDLVSWNPPSWSDFQGAVSDITGWDWPTPTELVKWAFPTPRDLLEWTFPKPMALLNWAFPDPMKLLGWEFPSPSDLLNWDFPSPSELLGWDFPSPSELLGWDFPDPSALLGWDYPAPEDLLGWDFPAPGELLSWGWPDVPTFSGLQSAVADLTGWEYPTWDDFRNAVAEITGWEPPTWHEFRNAVVELDAFEWPDLGFNVDPLVEKIEAIDWPVPGWLENMADQTSEEANGFFESAETFGAGVADWASGLFSNDSEYSDTDDDPYGDSDTERISNPNHTGGGGGWGDSGDTQPVDDDPTGSDPDNWDGTRDGSGVGGASPTASITSGGSGSDRSTPSPAPSATVNQNLTVDPSGIRELETMMDQKVDSGKEEAKQELRRELGVEGSL